MDDYNFKVKNKEYYFQVVSKIIAKILNIQEKNIFFTASVNDFENCDSLNHFKIIIELEKEFELKFSPSEIEIMIDVNKIINLIELKDRYD